MKRRLIYTALGLLALSGLLSACGHDKGTGSPASPSAPTSRVSTPPWKPTPPPTTPRTTPPTTPPPTTPSDPPTTATLSPTGGIAQ